MDPPLISVITPTFNCGPKIAATVASVLVQKKGLYEFLVIDGGSTDGSLAHVHAQGPALRLLSEPDEGIYDALNKGIRLASGEFLYFLGAGDRLLPGVLEVVAAEIRKLPCQRKTSRPMLLYGDVSLSIDSRPYDGRFNRFKLLRRNICHQAIFYQRSVFERVGFYNTKYRSLADWEFNIRCFNDQGIYKRYVPLQIAEYEGGGKSQTMPDLAFQEDFPRQAGPWYARGALFNARDLLVKVGFAPAWRQIVEALRLSHSPRVLWEICSFFVLWLRIFASQVKRCIKSKFNASTRS
jgi:glycosyltransferase involved in cell wall biosynthesis